LTRQSSGPHLLGPVAEHVDPDIALLERVAHGDGDAFADLVERHQDRLVRVCGRLLADPEEARDAVQEVFLKAYRSAAGFRPRGRVFTWLYRIAVNHCLNRLRRRRLARFVPLLGGSGQRDDAPEFDPRDERPGPEVQHTARERWARLSRAIAGLPPGQRVVLLLARLEGLSQREIAHTLAITEGAVESRLVRALRTLARVEASQESGGRGVS
jgi:RNA polymerase sigma-70 factor (ECF subfamily)